MAARGGSGTVHVHCRRWIKPVDAPALYPNSVTLSELEKLPEAIGAQYEECDGQVACYYEYEPESPWGYYGATPASESFEPGECDTCGTDDWSEADKRMMLEDARDGGCDDGGGDGDDD